MKRFNLEEFKQGKFAVQCETEEQANEFLKYLKDNGIIYQAGVNTIDYSLWKIHKENTYYRVVGHNKLVKGNVEYKALGVTIIKYTDLDFIENLIDCSVTENYFKEKNRMTNKCTIHCSICKFDRECYNMEKHSIEKAIEIVQEWSNNNPEIKTKKYTVKELEEKLGEKIQIVGEK